MRVMVKKVIISLFCLIAISACNEKSNQSVSDQVFKKTNFVDEQQNQPLSSGIEIANIDFSIRPQDDLFRHVNGKWLDAFEIPADKSNYGAFTKLADKSRDDVRQIIEQASQSDAIQGTDNQKVGDLYKSYMDEAVLNALGIKPIQSELDKIDAVSDISDLSEYIAYAQMMTGAPFYTQVGIDSKAPSTYITKMGQSGLGLPNREFYFDEDDKKIRKQYLEHISNMFQLVGIADSRSKAASVMSLETQLATKQWPKEKLRDPIARYNKYSLEQLRSAMPNIDWPRWTKIAMLEKMENVIVAQPDYLIEVNRLLEEIPIENWKIYFKWKLVSASAPFLSNDIAQEKFRFYRGVLSGVEQQEPRWKRGVNIINRTLGEVVGKIYVSKHFKPQAKQEMIALVEQLRAAYAQAIDELDWMGKETKQQAKDKLSKFSPKIGYPDKWKDYSSLEIDANDLFGNMQRASMFEETHNRKKLGKPIDRNEWFMTPQTVNAYYNPVLNEIVFPAAILQPPFFNLNADDAVNYGAIGAVIGHEMGHGFDDSGSKYDGDGKLRNWWTDSDRAEFKKRTEKLVLQYDSYVVLDDVHLNGEFTQGENIGDLSGLTIAYKAYQLSKNGKQAPVIDGLTADQRVFFGWAQVWARKYRDEELRRRIDTGTHSPSEFRANGVVKNMPEFYHAFNVKEGDGMYIAEQNRVKIW